MNSEAAVATRTDNDDLSGEVGAASRSRLDRALPLLERYALVVLLLVLIVFFSVLPATGSTFLTLANIRNVAANEAVIAITALAALVPLVAGQFDISVGAVLGMVSIAVA